jgi:hypothetical protein
VANEPLTQDESAKKPKTHGITSAKLSAFVPPPASEHSEEKVLTPSVMVPLGERNLNQNV